MKSNKNFFNVYIQTIKNHMSVSIVYLILTVISFPILQVICQINTYAYSTYTGIEAEETIRTCAKLLMEIPFSIVVMVFSAIMSFMAFSYMHKKRSVDYYNSMPVTRRTEFFARMAAIASICIAPIILCTILGTLIASVSGVAAFSFAIMGILILGVLANIAFVGFISVCCGTVAHTIVSYGLINMVYPICVLIFKYFPETALPGYNLIDIAGINVVTTALSPLFAPFATYKIRSSSEAAVTNIPIYVIWWICFIAAIGALTYVLVKKRKAESAQAGFAFIIPRMTIKIVTAVAAGFIGGIVFQIINSIGNSSTLSGAIWFTIGFALICFAAHILLHLIYHGNLRNFAKGLVLYGCELIIGIVFFFIIETGLFGYVSRVPEANNVEKIVLKFNDPDFESFYINGKDLNALTISDKEDIEFAIGLQKDITNLVDDTKEKNNDVFYTATPFFSSYDYEEVYNEEYGDFESYICTYYMKDGSKITRNYDEYYIINHLITSEKFKTVYNMRDNSSFTIIPDKYCNYLSFDIVNDEEAKDIPPTSYYTFNGNSLPAYLVTDDEKEWYKRENAMMKKLLSAIKKDYNEIGDISAEASSKPNYISVELYYTKGGSDYTTYLTIDERYKRTLSLLNSREATEINSRELELAQ